MRIEIFDLEDTDKVAVIPDTIGPRGIARALAVFAGDSDWDERHRGECAALLADLTATGASGFAPELRAARAALREAFIGVDVL